MTGEPSGTAGAPMLNILQKRELTNVLVIVTRYFGGILLGTGGLVRAYSEAAMNAIQTSGEVIKEEGYIAEISLDYSKDKEFGHICEKNLIKIVSKDYTDVVKNVIEISKEKYNMLFPGNNFQNLPIIIKGDKYTEKMN